MTPTPTIPPLALARWAKQLAYFKRELVANDEKMKSLCEQLQGCKSHRSSLEEEARNAQAEIDRLIKELGRLPE